MYDKEQFKQLGIVSGIYKIENLVNHKLYIGQSSNIEKRWKNHIKKLKHNKHDNSHIQRAWNKYGESNFKFSILLICGNNRDKLNVEEDNFKRFYIKKIGRKNIYNMAATGESHDTCEEVRNKIRKKRNKRIFVYDSECNLIRCFDSICNLATFFDSYPSKLSVYIKKHKNYMGLYFSKKPIIEIEFYKYFKKGINIRSEGKIFQYCLKSHNLLKIFKSTRTAGTILGILFSEISRSILWKKHFKNFIFSKFEMSEKDFKNYEIYKSLERV